MKRNGRPVPRKSKKSKLTKASEPDGQPKEILTEKELEESYKKHFSDKIATKATDNITDLNNPKYKVLIQTVNSNEFYAAMMQLKGHKATMYIGHDERFHSYSYYYVGVWDTIPVVIIQTGMGSNGVHSCWYETKIALHFMPQLEYIFSVGVCGGVAGKVNLGDVVVSRAIYGYNDLKKTPSGWISRSMCALCTETQTYHCFSRADNIPPPGIVVKPGVVLSGPWLIADNSSQCDLLKLAPEAIAFEMEGSNIVQACGHTKVECLVVKGVSDLADKDKDDDWQPQAATNAVKYLCKAMKKAKHLFIQQKVKK